MAWWLAIPAAMAVGGAIFGVAEEKRQRRKRRKAQRRYEAAVRAEEESVKRALRNARRALRRRAERVRTEALQALVHQAHQRLEQNWESRECVFAQLQNLRVRRSAATSRGREGRRALDRLDETIEAVRADLARLKHQRRRLRVEIRRLEGEGR